MISEAYRTRRGKMLVGRIEDALDGSALKAARGKVNLIFTSPPFPLVHKKRYGNESGGQYLKWLESLAPRLCDLLAPKGSIVIEIGNSWEPGVPVMSTLGLEALLAFKRAGKLHLCQHVICHNPARLPSPAQWVNVKRERLKDSFTHVWWMSRKEHPKADNKRVLLPYSDHMKGLLKSKKYNAGVRPSGHVISSKGFLTDHGGAIAPNVIRIADNDASLPEALLQFSGTSADLKYRQYCKDKDYELHPARMQMGLASFFIEFLTEPGDLILDPFAGSNTTGYAAETLKRRWISVEVSMEYAHGSKGRVGLLCREALISLAQSVFDPERHVALDSTRVSDSDSKRMLEAYIAVEYSGSANEHIRKHARAVCDLAVHLQHRRTATFREAAACVEATTSTVNLIATMAGLRDPLVDHAGR